MAAPATLTKLIAGAHGGILIPRPSEEVSILTNDLSYAVSLLPLKCEREQTIAFRIVNDE